MTYNECKNAIIALINKEFTADEISAADPDHIAEILTDTIAALYPDDSDTDESRDSLVKAAYDVIKKYY